MGVFITSSLEESKRKPLFSIALFLVTDPLYAITVFLVPDRAVAQESVAVSVTGPDFETRTFTVVCVFDKVTFQSVWYKCLKKWNWDRDVLSYFFNFTLSLSLHHCSSFISIHRLSMLWAVFSIIKLKGNYPSCSLLRQDDYKFLQ